MLGYLLSLYICISSTPVVGGWEWGCWKEQWTWGNLNKFARRHLNKTFLPSPASFRKLWCWVLTQLRKYIIENSSSKLACFEPSLESWLFYLGGSWALVILGQPSEEPVSCAELTWLLYHCCIVLRFSRLPSPLSALPIMFPECSLSSSRPSWRPTVSRCRRALWQMWFMPSLLLVWGKSFLTAALVSQSAPAGGRAALLTLIQQLRIKDEVTRDDADARHASAARDHFKKNTREHETQAFCSKAIWHGVTSRLCPAEIPLL